MAAETIFFVWVFIGLALSIGFILVGRRSEAWEKYLLAGSLWLAGIWYVAFGLTAGTPYWYETLTVFCGARLAHPWNMGLCQSTFFGCFVHANLDSACMSWVRYTARHISAVTCSWLLFDQKN